MTAHETILTNIIGIERYRHMEVYDTDIFWNLNIERSETQYLTAHIMSVQYSIDATILT